MSRWKIPPNCEICIGESSCSTTWSTQIIISSSSWQYIATCSGVVNCSSRSTKNRTYHSPVRVQAGLPSQGTNGLVRVQAGLSGYKVHSSPPWTLQNSPREGGGHFIILCFAMIFLYFLTNIYKNKEFIEPRIRSLIWTKYNKKSIDFRRMF